MLYAKIRFQDSLLNFGLGLIEKCAAEKLKHGEYLKGIF